MCVCVSVCVRLCVFHTLSYLAKEIIWKRKIQIQDAEKDKDVVDKNDLKYSYILQLMAVLGI